MFKRLLLTGIALLLTACVAARPTATPTRSPEELAGEEEAVYAAVLKSLYDAPAYVLVEATGTDPGGVDDAGGTLDYVLQNLHDVAADTADGFRRRNAEASALVGNLDLGAPYTLMSRDEMSGLFSQNQDGWQLFYERFPDAPGITTVSRVGFNQGMDQALVYVGTQSHWLAGAGYYLLLNKVDGAWVIDQQVMTWIS